MEIAYLLFERGVRLVRYPPGGGWIALGAGGKLVSLIPEQGKPLTYAGNRLILVERAPINGKPGGGAIFSPGHKAGLEFLPGRVESSASIRGVSLIDSMFGLSYLCGAVLHHLECLATRYAVICESFAEFPMRSKANHVQFGSQEVAYYEFDSLVTSIQRTFELFNNKLAEAVLGPVKPGKEPKVCRLPEGEDEGSASFRASLIEYRDTHGTKLKDYRDCIQHFVFTLNDRGGAASMERNADDVWTAWLPIPDNPAAKRARSFRYDEKKDALTYGWTMACEVLEIAERLLQSLDPEAAEAHERALATA